MNIVDYYIVDCYIVSMYIYHSLWHYDDISRGLKMIKCHWNRIVLLFFLLY